MAEVGVNLPVIVSAGLLLAGAILTGIFGLINRRTDARASKEPTMDQIWTRLDSVETKLDLERSARQTVSDLLRTLRNVFVDYVDRVQSGGSNELTPDEREALEETKEKLP